MYMRDTLRFLEAANISKAEREAIAYGNLERITGTKLVK